MLFILFLYKAYVKTRNNCLRQGASLDAVNPCLFPSASISYRRFVCGCVLQYVVVLWCVQKPPIGPIPLLCAAYTATSEKYHPHSYVCVCVSVCVFCADECRPSPPPSSPRLCLPFVLTRYLHCVVCYKADIHDLFPYLPPPSPSECLCIMVYLHC
jgi:hypothetical protein